MKSFFLVQVIFVFVSSLPLQSEKAMTPHSSTLAWKIPWMEEPGGPKIHGVAKSRTRLSNFTFTFLHWRRQWQPTPVFLPGESQGRGSLVGCRLWGRTYRTRLKQLSSSSTTSVFLPWEPHEQYEKAKWKDTERGTPQVSRCPGCYWRSVEK